MSYTALGASYSVTPNSVVTGIISNSEQYTVPSNNGQNENNDQDGF